VRLSKGGAEFSAVIDAEVARRLAEAGVKTNNDTGAA
jgi:hypothetical protein